jgi:putative transposase
MSEQQNLKELSDFIDSNPDPREQKRALAIMMSVKGVPCSKIQKILNVSPAFISQCKAKFIKNGVEDLRLKYQGSKAYLNQLERTEIIKYLDAKEFVSLQELREYIEDKYDVRFKSNQSYYQLFDEAEIRWKKTQKKNQKKTINW